MTYVDGDGYTAPVVYKKTYSSVGAVEEQTLYLHRDYQGSILAITNEAGAVLEKRQFDAWGAIVKVQDGAGNALNGLTILDRGYTGHEHLQSVGLIHMNGRLYDPKLHRFLQPDNYVQDTENTQNYNRYGYVLNNPLKYTDPSGEFKINLNDIIAAVAVVAGTILSFVPGGAAIGVPLIGAGVAHFGATYAEYSKTGDWNAASNNAGISFSATVKTDWGYGDSKDSPLGINQNKLNGKSTQRNAAFYYDALDGIQFNNGAIKKRGDFVLTFKPSVTGNAEYLGFKGGKYHINFDISDFEVTKENIRALTIHEAYAHGDMNYGDDTKDHYKAYTLTIDSKYWEATTYEFKHNQVYKMWSYFYREVGNKRMKEKYMTEYDKYIKQR